MTKKYPKSIKFDKKHQTLPVVRSSPPPPPLPHSPYNYLREQYMSLEKPCSHY